MRSSIAPICPMTAASSPVAVALCAIVALWLSLDLIGTERSPQIVRKEARAAAVLVSRPMSH